MAQREGGRKEEKQNSLSAAGTAKHRPFPSLTRLLASGPLSSVFREASYVEPSSLCAGIAAGVSAGAERFASTHARRRPSPARPHSPRPRFLPLARPSARGKNPSGPKVLCVAFTPARGREKDATYERYSATSGGLLAAADSLMRSCLRGLQGNLTVHLHSRLFSFADSRPEAGPPPRPRTPTAKRTRFRSTCR